MPSRNGKRSRPESVTGGGAVRVRSPNGRPPDDRPPDGPPQDGRPASEDGQPANGSLLAATENGTAAAESGTAAAESGTAAAESESAASEGLPGAAQGLPGAAQGLPEAGQDSEQPGDSSQQPGGNPPGQSTPPGKAAGPSEPAAGPPKLPKRYVPPDRPRPPEPRGPTPPAPDKLPKRVADASRPSVPSRRPRRPMPGNGTVRAGPPGSLPPELFRPLWWQERPGPASPPSSSPSPQPPQELGPAGPPRPPQEPSPAGPPVPSPREPTGQEPTGQEATAPEAGVPGPASPAQRPAAQPSWAAVLATTVRLWAQRRLRWARRLWPARAGWRLMIVVALVAAVFVAGAATVALSRSGRGKQDAGRASGAAAAAAASTLATAAAARQQAAAWVASQANPDAIVACDPQMCTALQARGVPGGQLLVLTPAQADPLGSDLVVATPAVRSQFGARLAGVYAPVTLASFGSGAARIDVRAMAPDGAASYWKSLAADIRARKAAGALMLHNSRIHAGAAAAAALAAGEVDPRLLVTLATLAHLHPLYITGFGRASPGASAGVPLRSADVAAAAPPGSRPVPLRALMAVLRAQRPPYLPSSLEIVRIPPGGAVLRIEYPVPSPLGLLGSGG